jgi:alpha-amylase
MTEINGVMIQYFQAQIPNDGTHWDTLKNQVKDLAEAGFTTLWLPPAYKGSEGIQDIGYTAYDLFDLGEFDQKGTVRTKYGTREQYLAAIQAAQQQGMQVYADVVLGHKTGGDEAEMVEAIAGRADDRQWKSRELIPTGTIPSQAIKILSQFTFPGRNGKYSDMTWHKRHFDCVHHNLDKPGDSRRERFTNRTLYRLKDKEFETEVDPRYGLEDFLTTCAIDTTYPKVQEALKHWGEWFLETTGVNGFRLDAVAHIRAAFCLEWLTHIRYFANREIFAVGDYWADDVESLHEFIHQTNGQLSLFDVPLHYNFHRASRASGNFDMRRILNGSLMREQPSLAVTFVENHASQPLQLQESVVEPWFKPLAYALILLRREGYPCVFYADYYGAHYHDKGHDGKDHEIWLNAHRWLIDKFLYARRHFAYGAQYDYFDHPDCIGWTRLGNSYGSKAMAVIMSDGAGGSKWMEVGRSNTVFHDITEHVAEPVRTNEHGWGDFCCNGGSVSVWVEGD